MACRAAVTFGRGGDVAVETEGTKHTLDPVELLNTKAAVCGNGLKQCAKRHM
jgi:hypothetical protein